MSNLERRVLAGKTPLLRVFYGEETDSPEGGTQLDNDQPSHDLNEEVEEVWSGHTLAARLSARIAA